MYRPKEKSVVRPEPNLPGPKVHVQARPYHSVQPKTAPLVKQKPHNPRLIPALARGNTIQRTRWVVVGELLQEIRDDGAPPRTRNLLGQGVPGYLREGDTWDDATGQTSTDPLHQAKHQIARLNLNPDEATAEIKRLMQNKEVLDYVTADPELFARIFYRGETTPPLLQKAQCQIARLDLNPDEATVELNRLMQDEQVYARVAADRDLFARLFHRVKAPAIPPGYRFSSDPQVDRAKRGQEIHSVYDQLHYILNRTGSGPQGLANRQGWRQQIGTETLSEMTAATAREVQLDALAKLILLFHGEQVRMPVYTHRFGPMRPNIERVGFDRYCQDAANNMNSLLSSSDPIGANVRVTDADRGAGAYVSTDSDNFYGPHGVAFDPRDLHTLPLSIRSLDNKHEVSSERTKDKRHQFRALGQPIPLTEGGQRRYAEIFVGTEQYHLPLLAQTLRPRDFTRGVLSNSREEILRATLRRLAGRPGAELPAPPQLLTSPDHEQPKSNEHVYLMRELVQELNGLYEPHAWTTLWRDNEITRMEHGLQEALAKMAARTAAKADVQEDSNSDWDDEP